MPVYQHTFYEVSLRRPDRANPLSKQDWLEIVQEDEDIVCGNTEDHPRAIPDCELWVLKSHPEGTPIYFEDGAIFIREDDSTTIEKLVALAERLDAEVVGEDGTVYFDIGASTPGSKNQKKSPVDNRFSPKAKIVILDEERIRRRQAGLGLIFSLAFPLYTAWIWHSGENPGSLYLWALGSIALGVLCAMVFFKAKYYLEFFPDAESNAYVPNTKNTDDACLCKKISRGQLDPLEVVWFALEYPSKKITEFHVRSQKNPWLVFWAGSNKEKAKSMLFKIGQSLAVNTVDKSSGDAASNIPKKYLKLD